MNRRASHSFDENRVASTRVKLRRLVLAVLGLTSSTALGQPPSPATLASKVWTPSSRQA